MADEIETKSSGALKHVDSPHAPHIYFEGAPVYASYNGIVAITLDAMRAIPSGDGTVTNDLVAVAYLRCNILAAKQLRDSLDKAILVAEPVTGKAN